MTTRKQPTRTNQTAMDGRTKSEKRVDRCRLKRGEDSACQDLAGTLSNSESAQRMPAYKSHIKHHDTLALWQQSHVSIPNRNKLVPAVYEVVSKRYSAGAGKTPNPREKGEEILATIQFGTGRTSPIHRLADLPPNAAPCPQGCAGSVTNPMRTSPAFAAADITWATVS